MSLDIWFENNQEEELYSKNITHNLNKMAMEAGFYQALWRPEEIGLTKASELIPYLETGIAEMIQRPTHYQEFDASNGWGTYHDFLPWLAELLEACREYPESLIKISR